MGKKKDVTDAIVEIVSVSENEDGSAKITFSLNDDFIALYKKDTGKKRATKKGLSDFLYDIVMRAMDERYK
jgi:hypothetical protein